MKSVYWFIDEVFVSFMGMSFFSLFLQLLYLSHDFTFDFLFIRLNGLWQLLMEPVVSVSIILADLSFTN